MAVFTGFTQDDFDVFTIPGLEPRMDAIKERIRPKLEFLGTHFSKHLTLQLGEEVYAHVAKHARRTVNPPHDTWVAFSHNARGYKQHPHFQIGLWQTHVFITFGYIYEAPTKASFGRELERTAATVYADIPADFIYILDHTSPTSIPASDVGITDIEAYGRRLREVKKAELLIGRRIEADRAKNLSGEAFIDLAENTMHSLFSLHHLSSLTGFPKEDSAGQLRA